MFDNLLSVTLLALVAIPIAFVIRNLTRHSNDSCFEGNFHRTSWSFRGLPAIYAMVVLVLVCSFVLVLRIGVAD